MKYHQLVPVRAINALSDWLVYNLEELGVEDSLVYSRLLLSLLHTTVHVNNIEQAADIPYFKEFVTLNKSYQVSQLDTEELKRFAAVNLLIEATSNNSALEKDNSTIIELVNELHRKFYDIERESAVATDTSTSAATTSEDISVGEGGEDKKTTPKRTIDNIAKASFDNDKQSPRTIEPRSIEDRTNMYYNAFPALMNLNAAPTRNLRPDIGNGVVGGQREAFTWSMVFNNATNRTSAAAVAATAIGNKVTASGIKKKPKRKRSGTSKPKSLYGKKQTSVDDTLWDMDFQGTWEMGQDEVFKIESLKRNRSVSEGEIELLMNDKYSNNNNNNNFEHVVSFYQHEPTAKQFELMKATMKKFNDTVEAVVCFDNDEQVAQMEEKFERIRTLWNDEDNNNKFDDGNGELEGGMYAVMPVASDDVRCGNIWEPLQPLEELDDTTFRPLRRSLTPQGGGTSSVSPLPLLPSSSSQQQSLEMLPQNAEYLQILPRNSVWANTVEAADEEAWGNARHIFNNYALPTQETTQEPEISLRNHSVQSLFKRVTPNYPAVQRAEPQAVEVRSRSSEVTSEENLLLSHSTHFSPIKKRRYPNGYTFPTNDSMLKVDFYRSESCSLYAGNDKYMEVDCEYVVEDFETDDEPLPHLVPIFPCVDKEKFTVKILLHTQNEKACQTDDMVDVEDTDKEIMDTRRIEFAHGWRFNEYILQDTKIDYVEEPEEPKKDDDLLDPWTKGGHFCHKNNNSYSVWQKCEGCDDTQPVPADPQLKEELYAEGEDILYQLWSLNIEKRDWEDDIPDVGNGVIGGDGSGINSPERYNEYHRVDNFVSELLKPETTQNLAKALAQERFLPFDYLLNCATAASCSSVTGKKRKSNGELVLGYANLPPTPPQVEMSLTEGLMNLCNYIDTNRVVRLPYEPTTKDRKRRHSASKNGQQWTTTDFGYGDYGGGGGGGGTGRVNTKRKDGGLQLKAKPYILRNDIFLTQIDDISRPLTR